MHKSICNPYISTMTLFYPQIPFAFMITQASYAYGRPLAYAAGGTDDLAHSMGHTRSRLGLHMAATALPAGAASDTQPEDAVVYFGIIDILQVRSSGRLLGKQNLTQHDSSRLWLESGPPSLASGQI